jgi:TonB family protein
MKRRALEAEVSITLDATGNVLESVVTARSGDAAFDAGVQRAIDKSSPLPPPPDSGEWPVLFSSQD